MGLPIVAPYHFHKNPVKYGNDMGMGSLREKGSHYWREVLFPLDPTIPASQKYLSLQDVCDFCV